MERDGSYGGNEDETGTPYCVYKMLVGFYVFRRNTGYAYFAMECKVVGNCFRIRSFCGTVSGSGADLFCTGDLGSIEFR